MLKKTISVLLLLGIGLASWVLPKARRVAWSETRKPSPVDIIRSPLSPDEVDQVEAEISKDSSHFDQKSKSRSIRSVPNNNVQLEVAFRQRENDYCEHIPAGQPQRLQQFVYNMGSDGAASNACVATRRQVLTVGLDMLEEDQRLLPTLSRSSIKDYIASHYISIQAKWIKDRESDNWLLSYRPMACICKMNGLLLTEEWVEAISVTVADIRGLGIYDAKDPSDVSQTAVLIFRSAWVEEGLREPQYRYELGVIHAIPRTAAEATTDDPWSLEMFTTSGERTVWHHFRNVPRHRPQQVRNCDLFANVRFIDFTPDGLQPKNAATRSLKVNQVDSFRASTLDSYLSSKGLNGGWSKNLKQAISAMLDNAIESIQ